ncbi:hypothetical protein HYT56_03160, partial [Candidatus Woesearchaeota archaeon]|nr:hypothetical protein [Candidatus Woesearchaeota archaeon]
MKIGYKILFGYFMSIFLFSSVIYAAGSGSGGTIRRAQTSQAEVKEPETTKTEQIQKPVADLSIG